MLNGDGHSGFCLNSMRFDIRGRLRFRAHSMEDDLKLLKCVVRPNALKK